MSLKWSYYLYSRESDGEYFCVQELTDEAAEEVVKINNPDDYEDYKLINKFDADDAGDAYVDSLGLDVF